MKEIKWIAETIDSELEAAEHYAKAVHHYKDSDKELSRLCVTLAEAEMEHVDRLHRQAVRVINEYKETGREAPAAMQAVWNWQHEKMIERTIAIQKILSMGNS
jgi:rubrerythrin